MKPTVTKKGLLIMISMIISTGLALSKQKVPVTFDKYHGYTGTTEYIKKVAEAYPDITELMIIGESTMGRPIYVLVISNMKNGINPDQFIKLQNTRAENVKNVTPMKSYQGKPGHFLAGSTHGNEYTGTEVCIYIIDKLVSGYGDDPAITDIVDRCAFYINPVGNPDGVYNSVEKGIPQRANSMLIDDDNDGKINEDGPDDINNDGFMTSFRYKNPKGEYVIDDVDPRLMVRVRPSDSTNKQRYSVVSEDIDNDKDGKRGEDSESGIDLNRNYPEGWWTEDYSPGGLGDYPTSAKETRAIAEFFTTYRNILMAQFFHTSGGFTYRPMGTAPNTSMNAKDIAIFDYIMGKKYVEIMGEKVPEEWLNPGRLNQYKEKLKDTNANKYVKLRGYDFPYTWKSSYDENTDKRYGFGMVIDWLYAQHGIYALTTELWNQSKDIPGLPKFEGRDANVQLQRALLKYQDEKYNGSLFVGWKSFKHPDLGDGEVGGWKSQYSTNNALPGEPLLGICEKHWQFEMFRAGLMPKLKISAATARVLYTSNTAEGEVSGDNTTFNIKSGKNIGKYSVVEVTAKIENLGVLPTHLAAGARLPGNREDVVWLLCDRKEINFIEGRPVTKIGVLGGTDKVSGTARPGDNTKELKWIVAIKGDAPIRIMVSSQKGGTVIENLTIK
jgi:hypothetical protein